MEIRMILTLGDLVVLEALLDRTMCHAIRECVFIINDCIENLSLVLVKSDCVSKCAFIK